MYLIGGYAKNPIVHEVVREAEEVIAQMQR
jgi:hypothetical protein